MPRPSRTHDAVDQLLDAIIAGRLTAGERLPPEGQLATEFGVSRLTMREAVRLLQAQGVIVQVPGSRHRIAPVSEWTGMDAVVRHARSAGQRRTSSLELLEVRMMIESGAAQLAAERRTGAHLAELEDALARMEQHHEAGELDAFVAADLEFHDVVLHAADNRILVAALLPLTSMLTETRAETSQVPEIRQHAIDEHRKVLEAIRAGVPSAAREAMASHMVQTRDDLLSLVLD
ncbi:FadR family transcriptional regulator [Agrococcus lahaulensis]|uniref:FadR/GntR family transcriptional regulator n=1 Tax=unclassified Agrococcus TaxID=2615065 RepID=UPI000FE36228|nr:MULTISPECIES: FadR/GntR family transcriptional regulator [unclassified Agrococcus]MDR7233811.1 DNA-binding FadR family transcriptional regulator [Agrococcus sp. BE272]RWR23775.1 FadR family transcriptional regulator [Agrococcus lahaulensis]UOW01701.1 FadR family transcriptional regulator [Agrococcus sp. SCSIO52902]